MMLLLTMMSHHRRRCFSSSTLLAVAMLMVTLIVATTIPVVQATRASYKRPAFMSSPTLRKPNPQIGLSTSSSNLLSIRGGAAAATPIDATEGKDAVNKALLTRQGRGFSLGQISGGGEKEFDSTELIWIGLYGAFFGEFETLI